MISFYKINMRALRLLKYRILELFRQIDYIDVDDFWKMYEEGEFDDKGTDKEDN